MYSEKIIRIPIYHSNGVIEAPHEWSFPFRNNENDQYKLNELVSSDGLLPERVTYQAFAEAWPSRTDEEGFADRFNIYPKHIVSTTLKHAGWNNSTMIKENIAGQIAARKQQSGKDIMINGSAALIKTLVKEDLIDEYH